MKSFLVYFSALFLLALSTSTGTTLAAGSALYEVAVPSVRPVGAPDFADVSLRYGWVRTSSFPTVADAQIAIRDFHATRVDWFYTATVSADVGETYVTPESQAFIDWCHDNGLKIGGAINTNTTNIDWYLKDGPFPDRYIGDPSDADYIEAAIAWGTAQIDAGIDTLVCDDFFFYNASEQQLFSNNVIAAIKAYQPGFTIAGNLGDSIGTDYVTPYAFDFHYSDSNFTPSVSEMWDAAKAHRAEQSAFLMHPNRSMTIPARRTLLALGYGVGAHLIAPWDEFISQAEAPNDERLFEDPADFADLYGFARALGQLGYLNGYEDAAVGGYDLVETRYGGSPPISVTGGSGQLSVFGRAQPGQSDAPVVFHLVESGTGQAATLRLKIPALYKTSHVSCTLYTPPAYDQAVHQAASTSGDYAPLAAASTLSSSVEGDELVIAVPAVNPWGALVIAPGASSHALDVNPASATVVAGGTQAFTASVVDASGNPLIPQPPIGWTVTGGGSIDGSGLFTAGPYVATSTVTARAALDGGEIVIGSRTIETQSGAISPTVAYWQFDGQASAPVLVDSVGGYDLSVVSGSFNSSALAAVNPLPNPDPNGGLDGDVSLNPDPGFTGASLLSPGDNVQSRLTVSNDPGNVFNLSGKHFTLEGWIQHDGTTPEGFGDHIAGTRISSPFRGYALKLNEDGTIECYFADGTGTWSVKTSGTNYIGTDFIHFALVWQDGAGDNGTGKADLYIDGVLEATASAPAAWSAAAADSGNDFTLAGRAVNGNNWDGRFDEFRFSNVALAPSGFLNATSGDAAPFILGLSPSAGSTNAPVAGNLTVTFSESIALKSGGTLTITDTLNGSGTQVITLPDAVRASVSGSTLTIDPLNDLEYNTHYEVTIDANAIEDIAGTPNAFPGTRSGQWTFSTETSGIQAPPAWLFDPIAGTDATEDASYSGTLADNASDPNGDGLTFSKVSGPSWLTVGSDGTLGGTPTHADAGTNTFTVSVTDGIVAIPIQASLNITVTNTNDAPLYSTNPIIGVAAFADTPYNASIPASDADGNTLTHTKLSGPDWLTVHADGSLTGTPNLSDLGVSHFTVSVTDGISNTPVVADLVISVSAAPVPLVDYPFDSDATVHNPVLGVSDLSAGSFSGGSGLNNGLPSVTSAVNVSGRSLYSSNTFIRQDEASAISQNDYLSFTLTPDAGYQLDLNTLTFYTLRQSSDGAGAPSAFSVYTSADSFTAPVGSGSIPIDSSFTQQTVDLSPLQDLTNNTEVRIYFWAGEGLATQTERVLRLDELSLSGKVERVPGPLVSYTFDIDTFRPTRGAGLTNLSVSTLGAGPAVFGNDGSTAAPTIDSIKQAGAGALYSNNGGFYSTTENGALADGEYLSFALTPDPGFLLDLDTLSFYSLIRNQSESAGAPTNFAIYTSADDFTAPVGSGSLIPANDNTFTLQTVDVSSLQYLVGRTEVRIYLWTVNGPQSFNQRVFRLDEISLTGRVESVPSQDPPTWNTDPINEIDAIEDAPYTATLADNANDANGNNLTYAKVSGPAWLSVASNGDLSGTPTNADVGANAFRVSVTDGFIAVPLQADLNITVLNINDAPVFSSNPVVAADATEAVPYSGTLAGSATDDDGEMLTYAKVSGPAWLNIAPDGTLSGTPANVDTGTNVFTVSVTDGIIGTPVEANLNIKVSQSPVSLVEYKFNDNSTIFHPLVAESDLSAGQFSFGSGVTTVPTSTSANNAIGSGRSLFFNDSGFYSDVEGDASGGAIQQDDYLSFTLTAAPGFQVDMDTLSFYIQRQAADGAGAPTNYAVYTSADNFNAQIGTGTIPIQTGFSLHTVDMSAVQNAIGATEVRIILWAAEGLATQAERAFRLDELSLTGNVEVAPAPLLDYKFDSNETIYDPTVTAPNISVYPFSGGAGITLPNITSINNVSGRSLFSQSTFTQSTEGGALSSNQYLSFTVTVEPGFQMDLHELTFWILRRETSGLGAASNFSVYTSADGFVTQIATDAVPAVLESSVTFSQFTIDMGALENLTGDLEIRIYFWAVDFGSTTLSSERVMRIDELALSGRVEAIPVVAPDFDLAITPYPSTPGNWNFTWKSQPTGKVYDLVSSTSLGTPPSTWLVWNGYSNIASQGETTSLLNVLVGSDPGRFFSIVEKDAP